MLPARETDLTGTADHRSDLGRLSRLRLTLGELYHGSTRRAVRFRMGVLVVDLALIAFFIATPLLRERAWFLEFDYAIALLLIADLAARALAAPDFRRWALRPVILIDAVVLVTLLFPLWLSNLAFLRVLRLWSVIHSEFFWATVARRYDNTRLEDAVKAAATFLTFLFVVTGFVYALYARRIPGITGYIDALYFTVSTVTTTGYGDVTLPGSGGKLLAVVIMVSGISLFVRLAQALVRPFKVRFTCQACGLMRHDVDAVHCKACGALLKIPNDDE